MITSCIALKLNEKNVQYCIELDYILNGYVQTCEWNDGWLIGGWVSLGLHCRDDCCLRFGILNEELLVDKPTT